MFDKLYDQIDEMTADSKRIAQEAYENRQREIRALEKTASNTSDANEELKLVVENQKECIFLLKKQLDSDERQLGLLRDIFCSEVDGVAIEKDILRIIEEQIDDKHPLWDYVKDKGGDLAVAGLVSGAPVIYNAIKAFMQSKGIILP